MQEYLLDEIDVLKKDNQLLKKINELKDINHNQTELIMKLLSKIGGKVSFLDCVEVFINPNMFMKFSMVKTKKIWPALLTEIPSCQK